MLLSAFGGADNSLLEEKLAVELEESQEIHVVVNAAVNARAGSAHHHLLLLLSALFWLVVGLLYSHHRHGHHVGTKEREKKLAELDVGYYLIVSRMLLDAVKDVLVINSVLSIAINDANRKRRPTSSIGFRALYWTWANIPNPWDRRSTVPWPAVGWPPPQVHLLSIKNAPPDAWRPFSREERKLPGSDWAEAARPSRPGTYCALSRPAGSRRIGRAILCLRRCST